MNEDNSGVGRAAGWGWVLAYGILLIAGGLMALFYPLAAGFATAVLLGVLLIAAGLLSIFTGASPLATRSRVLDVVFGLIALAAGAFVLYQPFLAAASLAWAIGFWLVVSGLFGLVYGLRTPVDRGWRLFIAVADILLGGILLASGPLLGIAFIAALFAVSFLMRGVFFTWLALGLRRLSAR